jgi:hypothetical protein
MKARNAFITCLLLTSAISGCSYTGTNLRPYASWTGLIPEQEIQRHSRWALDANSSIYVALPASGHQDDALVGEMADVFARYFPRVRQGGHRETLEQAFVTARFAGMDYVVYPNVHTFAEQDGINKVVREEIKPSDFSLGEARMNIYIYASQGEELVDRLALDTRGSIFTADSRKLIWPPLDAYFKSISQFDLAHR